MTRRRSNSIQTPSFAESMQGLKADYQGARDSQFVRQRTGYLPLGSHSDWHTRAEVNLMRMSEKARDMDRNDALAGVVLNCAANNIVQCGFDLDPMTPDQGVNDELRSRMDAWSGDPSQCDISGKLTFRGMEFLAQREADVAGDIFCIPLATGELQFVEFHRCRTPSRTQRNVVHGILMDDNRRPIEYWFTKENIDPMSSVMRFSDIQVYSAWTKDGEPAIFHIFDPKRFTQSRGITAFAPIFDRFGLIEDTMFGAALKAQISNFYTIFHTFPNVMVPPQPGNSNTGPQTTEQLQNGFERDQIGTAPGMEIWGGPGEKIDLASPNVPNPEFFPHMSLEIQVVCLNLGIPLCMGMMDGRETNFSGYRGAVDEAKKGFRRRQSVLIDRFHRPVFRWKARQWAEEDKTLGAALNKLGEKYFTHRWNPPAWPYIQPGEDAKADAYQMQNRLDSPSGILSTRGKDWAKVAPKIVQDHVLIFRLAAAAAAELNAEFPDSKIDCRELMGLVPTRATAVVGDSAPEPPPATDTPPEPASNGNGNGNGNGRNNGNGRSLYN